jgi:hypothetical protein
MGSLNVLFEILGATKLPSVAISVITIHLFSPYVAHHHMILQIFRRCKVVTAAELTYKVFGVLGV